MGTLTLFDEGLYNILNNAVDLDTDTFKICLTNTAPDAAADDEFADITEIAAGNGYTATGETMTSVTLAETGAGTGIWQWGAADVVWTASGGSIGPFQYAVIYSDTSTGDKLIGYDDAGTAVTITTGNSFTFDIGSNGLILFQEA